ncbi:MAG: hypothetical protein EBT83_14420 [Betaproteobacteria bacterium]|nr:hypothetical protein [Betaproteobacteria bacterium]
MSNNRKSTLISRRKFIAGAAAVCAGMTHFRQALAQTPLAESDAQAVALGYKADSGKIDKTKQPKYVAGQVCSNCALYQGNPGAASGQCPLFSGKLVAARGWCTAWSKKA